MTPRAAPSTDAPRAAAIIPARLGSTRLPEKMLLAESGAALVVETARNVAASAAFERVVVATDDQRLRAVVEAAAIEAVMTRVEHVSGTDRIREAARALDLASQMDVLVNVQGDEPELAPDDLRALVACTGRADVELATLWSPLDDAEAAREPSIVKVVADAAERALYFSRAAIPHPGHDGQQPAFRRHVGVYGFRPAALDEFCDAAPGRLEQIERLEQLRWLELGRAIHLVRASKPTHGIDTRADYDAYVERRRCADDADTAAR